MKARDVITLPDEARARAVAALRAFAADHLDEELGDLKAGLLLDFVLEQLAPSIYNQAIADARAFIEGRAADLDATLHHDEFPGSRR